MTSAIVSQHLDTQAMFQPPPLPPAFSGDPHPARRHPFALQGKIYAIRIVYSVMAFVMLAASDFFCQAHPLQHGWLLFAVAAYPHVGHLMFGRADIRRRRGRTMFVIDGLFAGAVIAALGPAGIPAAIVGAINLFNWMVIGGPALLLTGTLTMLAGFATTVTGGLVSPATAVCAPLEWLAGIFLVCYLLIVAGVIQRLVQELGQHQLKLQTETDAASHARALAEGALLSALPPSAARRIADHGKIDPEDIGDATLLLLRFGVQPASQTSLEHLAELLHASDLILTRHGFEILKTFGRNVLAISRAATGPDDGVAAINETIAYFANHEPGNLPVANPPTVRAALSSGAVRLGLVQEERLNLELTGEAADALEALVAALEAVPQTRVVASPAAQQRLNDTAGFAFIRGDGQQPPHFSSTESGAAS